MNSKNAVFVLLFFSCFLISCVPLCLVDRITTTTTTIKTPPVTSSTTNPSKPELITEVISTVNDLSEHLKDLSDDKFYKIVIADLQPSLENINSTFKSFQTKKLYLNLEMSTKLTSISDNSFYENANVYKIDFPNTITEIGEKAFAFCSKIEELIIPNTVDIIRENSFSNCSNLKKVVLPSLLTTISTQLLRKCTALDEISLPDDVTTIDGGAFDSSGLKKIKLGSKITSIGQTAFYGCTSLKNVYFAGSLEQWCAISFESYDANPLLNNANLIIGDQTQDNIKIPNSITEIKDYCFYGCNCTSVTINNVTPPTIGKDIFTKCSKLTSIYVPTSSVDIYKNAEGWKQYKDKIIAIQ